MRRHNTVRKRGLQHLQHSACMNVWLLRELNKNPKQQPKMLNHTSHHYSPLGIQSLTAMTPCCLLCQHGHSLLKTLLCLRLSPDCETLLLLTLQLRVPDLTWSLPSLLQVLWVHVGTALSPFLVQKPPTSNSHKFL